MQPVSSARAQKNENIRELRLGLVCYGGVSLAIYMHGITKEIQKLVIASRAFEHDPAGANPFPEACSEHAYWEALKAAHGHSTEGVITRVVVDVVAGTSAGGINGIFLSKALAHNRSQDALRDLWFEHGDIQQLLGGGGLHEAFKLVKLAIELPFNHAEPPLDGTAMLGWLEKALTDMDGAPTSYPAKLGNLDSLMPSGHPLQLFVTTTDYHGYRTYLTISNPPTVTERRNRHLLEFTYDTDEKKDQFGPSYNVPLAFAARASSSFPGAFPPIRTEEIAAKLAKGMDLEQEFFRAYGLSGTLAANTYFIDGGVLNNYPFKPAIDAIVKARAEAQVDRYLLYLQPDPGGEIDNPKAQKPSLFGTIWAGLSSVASSQPIVDELMAARNFNERVQRINELVDATFPAVNDILSSYLKERAQKTGGQAAAMPSSSPAILSNYLQRSAAETAPADTQQELADQRAELDKEAERLGGYLYEPYRQIRIHSVIEQFATGIGDLCRYDVAESNLAYLIRLIVDRWALARKLAGEAADRDAQDRLLRGFDVGYTRRRLAFVLQGVNNLYNDPGMPSRVSLNLAKAALYDGMEELGGLISGESLGDGMQQRLLDLFPLHTLLAQITESRPLSDIAGMFVDQHGTELDQVYAQLGPLFRDRKNAVHAKLFKDFVEVTRDWSPEARQEVVIRYLGFPFWDAMIYPVTRLSEAGELRPINIVRVSPVDATGLSNDKNRLEGLQFAHFGAFFNREWRENDYLWGRLDAAERLIGLLLRDPQAGRTGFQAESWELKPVLAAILAEEEKEKSLPHIKPLVAELQKKVRGLPDRPDRQS